MADAGGGAGIEIGLAKREEVALCPEIERRAARLFSEGDSSPELADAAIPISSFALAQREGRLWVAREVTGQCVGFAFVTVLDTRGESDWTDAL